MRESPRRGREPAAGLPRRRLALFAATSLLAPGVLFIRAVLDQPHEPVISIAAGLLFLLVLARLTGLVRLQEALTEAALRRRYEARLAALVRHASDVVSIVDADGRVTYMSPSADRLLGQGAEALAGRPWEELVHPDDVEDLRTLLGSLLPGSSDSAEFRLRYADGSWRYVEALATSL